MERDAAHSAARGLDTPDRPVTALLVDDHDVVRAGLESVLVLSGMDVVGSAGSADEGVRLALTKRPDVILMDVRLDGESGIDATSRIRAEWPEARVVMLTALADDDILFASIIAGAVGFILKHAKREELVDVVRAVAAGHSLLDPSLTEAVLDRLRQGRGLVKDERLARLSRREEDVLTLVAEGRSNRDIGAALHMAEKTVKNHLTSVLSKLGVHTRTEAAAYFNRHAARFRG